MPTNVLSADFAIREHSKRFSFYIGHHNVNRLTEFREISY